LSATTRVSWGVGLAPMAVFFACSLSNSVAEAGYIASAGSFTPPSIIDARARNGLTGFEGALFTPAAPATGLSMNPVGTPAWSYGQYSDFAFNYDSTSGSATWSIDFNLDGDFLDAEESVTSVSPTLANQGFNAVNLFVQGSDAPSAGASVLDFTLNGTNFGAFSSMNGTATNQLFTYSSGTADITVTGRLSFTASGGSQERPRMWIQLGSSFVVPTPGALALLGVAGLVNARRRR
jgi:hypothetical protein